MYYILYVCLLYLFILCICSTCKLTIYYEYITTLMVYPTPYCMYMCILYLYIVLCLYFTLHPIFCMYIYIGLDAKYVLDLTDHVWVEIWVESLGRYVYVYCVCILIYIYI